MKRLSLRRLRAATLASTAVAACAVGAPPVQAAQTVDLIVRRDAGLSAAERAALRAGAGVRFERRLRLADTEVVTVPVAEATRALAELRADGDVRWAQRDGVVSAQAVTTDPGFASLWGLHNTGQAILGSAGTADADMDVPEAWAQSTGAGALVAVVDTGVDAGHPDLAGQLATNPGEQGAGRETNNADDDGNGLVDDWRGYDFLYRDNDPSDVDGHGSHVAGTIAALNGNARGITGAAPDARVLNLKALDDSGSGTWSALADAFDYAGDRGVRIVNASLGGPGQAPVVTDVIAAHPATLFVVAAGNSALDLDTTEVFPCEAPAANVVCVGASDQHDEKASFSNFSRTSVDVFAPGVSILSTTGGAYSWFNGTSMATPNVAAEAALILARVPALTAAKVKELILDTGDPRQGLVAYGVGGRRANAAAAVAAAASAPAAPAAPEPGREAGPAAEPEPAPAAAPVAPVDRPATPSAPTAEPIDQPVQQPVRRPTDQTRVLSPSTRVERVRVRGRRVAVTVTASRDMTLRVAVQRERCARGRCVFRTVATAGRRVRAGASVTLRSRALRPGRHRVVAGEALGVPHTRAFTVARRA